MIKTLLATALVFVIGASGSAYAGTSYGSLMVGATVIRPCQVTLSPGQNAPVTSSCGLNTPYATERVAIPVKEAVPAGYSSSVTAEGDVLLLTISY